MRTATPFRDLLFLLNLGLVAMVVWMLPWLNPPAVEDDTEPPGNLIVHIVWPKGNTDVDIWQACPGDERPIGYSNKSGLVCNLLRDDLGTLDATDLNFENTFSRGIVPGEYVINVHCFRCPVLPVPVQVEVSLKTDNGDKSGVRVIASTSVELRRNGEELTALRFELTADGAIVPGSLNHLFKPLRSYQGATP